MDKLIEQISRISKYTHILNQFDSLECNFLQDKDSIHILLYENDKSILDEYIDKIYDKSEKYIYKEINLLCDKLYIYKKKYEV
jgi:hypothetical protein